MIDPLLRRFIAYEKRKEAVIIGTIVAGLAVVWPATEDYIAARKQTHEAQLKLDEAEHSIAKLPQFMQMHKRKMQELSAVEKRMVNEDTARDLQGELMELGRATGCTVLRAQLADPIKRKWNTNDHPVFGEKIQNKGEESPFNLETRQLALSITGPMSNLYKFLEGVNKIDKVMHAGTMAIKGGSESFGSAESEESGTLDITLMLFNLTKPATAST